MRASFDLDTVEKRLDEGDTVEEIAAVLEVTARTVRNRLHAEGRPLQRQRRRDELQALLVDSVWLHEQIVENSRTLRNVARELRVSTEEIRAALESFGIDHPLPRSKQPPKQPELGRDALQAAFDAGETVTSIARSAGLDRSGVRRAMRRQGVVNPRANDHVRPAVLDSQAWLHDRYIGGQATIDGLADELGVAPLTVRKALVRQGIQIGGPHPRGEIDADWLRDQYIVRRRSLSDIAAEVGVSAATIGRALSRAGLLRTRPTIEIDRDWLHEQWVLERRTAVDIAAQLGISDSTVSERVRGHQLVREASSSGLDPIWLAEQYVTEKRTLADIALEVGLSASTIRRQLRNPGIHRVRLSAAAIDCEWLRIRYVVKRQGVKEIGAEAGTSATTISRAVRLHELQRPPRPYGPLALSDPVWLRGRYIGDGATAGDIANELGLPTSAVRNALRRHSITRT